MNGAMGRGQGVASKVALPRFDAGHQPWGRLGLSRPDGDREQERQETGNSAARVDAIQKSAEDMGDHRHRLG